MSHPKNEINPIKNQSDIVYQEELKLLAEKFKTISEVDAEIERVTKGLSEIGSKLQENSKKIRKLPNFFKENDQEKEESLKNSQNLSMEQREAELPKVKGLYSILAKFISKSDREVKEQFQNKAMASLRTLQNLKYPEEEVKFINKKHAFTNKKLVETTNSLHKEAAHFEEGQEKVVNRLLQLYEIKKNLEKESFEKIDLPSSVDKFLKKPDDNNKTKDTEENNPSNLSPH